MTYKTSVDAWLWPVLGFLLVGPPVMVVAGTIRLAQGDAAGVPLVASGAFLGALAYLLAWPVDYTLRERELIVRFGVARIRIAYASITEVAPTRNPLSSPAWSLDRLCVSYAGRRVLISPERRSDFLRDLAKRDASFRLEGGRLVRSPGQPS